MTARKMTKKSKPRSVEPSARRKGFAPSGKGTQADAAEPRRRAKAPVRRKADTSPESLAAPTLANTRGLLHELQVQKIELETQNEALRRAQLEIETSRARYFDLYDLAPVGYVMLDETGLILDSNVTFATLLGAPRDALVARPFSRLILKEDQDAFQRLCEGVMATFGATPGAGRVHEPQSRELRMVRRDGSSFWAKLIATPAPGERGEAALKVVLDDISALKEAAAKLAASERHLRAIFDTEPECVKLLADDGSLLEMNPAGLRMLEADSFRQVQNHCVYPLVVPEHRAAFQELVARVFRGESGTLEFQITGLKGARRWLETHASPLRDASGAITALLGITRDITEHRQAVESLREKEQRLSFLLNNTPAVIYSSRVSGDMGATYVTENVQAQLGYRPSEFVDDAAFWVNAIHPDDAKRVFANMPRLFEHGQHVQEYRFRHADGTCRWMRDESRLLRDAAGQPTQIIGYWIDVTERKQAEAALRESEERFHAIFDQAAVGVAQLTLEGRWLDVNQRLCAIVGYTRDELLTRSFQDITHPEDLEIDLNYLRQMLAGEIQTYALEKRYRRRDGALIWVNLAVSLVRDPVGAPGYFVSVVEDISERQRAQAALQESEKRYRQLFESNPHPMWVYDLETLDFLAVNAAAVAHYGYSEQEFLAMTIMDIRPPEDEERLRENLRLVTEGIDQAGIWRHRRKDGSLIEVEITSHTLDFSGRRAELVLAHDVTARRQAENALRESEERFRSLVESAPEAIYIQVDGRFAYANQACLRFFGATRSEELIGQSVVDLSHPDYRPVVARRMRQINEMREPIHAQDRVLLTLAGEIRHANISAIPFTYRNQPGALAFIRDVTERKQAEAARASLEAQLRESQKMEAIGTLAGGIAHDFNNILAIILGNAALVRQDVSANPRVLESLDEIRKAGTRARDLVQQILSFSRRQATEKLPIGLTPVVEESARLLRATLPARIALDVHCASDVPAVQADATQIEQLVLNLCSNAMQAIRSGPGRIGIRLDSVALDDALMAAHPALCALHRAHPGRAVRLEVSDDGHGMDEATIARIFEPFFTTKPVDVGTGLGLSVVHGIVQAHEGVILVDSHPGRGSTFTLYLPSTDAEAELSTPDPDVTVPAGTPHNGHRLHILYLDDDDALVFLATRLLERRGHRVSGYTGQEAALAALRSDPQAFDLFVTDQNMPGTSGLDVARLARSIRPDLPVVVTSGFIDDTLKGQAKDAGTGEVLFKANAVEEFCATLERLAQPSEDDSRSA